MAEMAEVAEWTEPSPPPSTAAAAAAASSFCLAKKALRRCLRSAIVSMRTHVPFWS